MGEVSPGQWSITIAEDADSTNTADVMLVLPTTQYITVVEGDESLLNFYVAEGWHKTA
jgi:hypothetical protein